MKAREKEQYLREYQILKSQGKPFFPYAVLKDSVMAVIVLAVIITMAVVLGAGELANKADPTTTTYTPRPEWYFYFLFELLRVIKPPHLTVLATIGIPTICLVLLLLLPFYDRNPERRPERRPIATTAAFATIAAMAYLTFLGATAEAPDKIDLDVPAAAPGRTERRQPVRVRRLSQVRRGGQPGPRPGPDKDRGKAPGCCARAHAAQPDGADAVVRGPGQGEVRRACSVPLRVEVEKKAEILQAEFRAAQEMGREAQVRTMFDRIADRYDLMNSVMTAGMHHRWRERTADLAQVGPGDSALDVCCGTGDLALELAGRVRPGGRVVGLDFSAPDARAGARRSPANGAAPVAWLQGNALELPFDDGEFDAATVGFGVRNVVDLERAIAEMARVVRPGGRVVILEITTPLRPPLSWFFAVWFDRIVPLLGTVAGDRDAYTYLPSSVRRFPPAAELAALMHRAGLREVRYLILAGGIIAIHSGTVAA